MPAVGRLWPSDIDEDVAMFQVISGLCDDVHDGEDDSDNGGGDDDDDDVVDDDVEDDDADEL